MLKKQYQNNQLRSSGDRRGQVKRPCERDLDLVVPRVAQGRDGVPQRRRHRERHPHPQGKLEERRQARHRGSVMWEFSS